MSEGIALASELRNARGVGRITVEADPAQLTISTELNLLLESSDRHYIHKRKRRQPDSFKSGRYSNLYR